MARKKKCKKCNLVFVVSEEDVIDVGTDFGAEFKYACPRCRSTEGSMEE